MPECLVDVAVPAVPFHPLEVLTYLLGKLLVEPGDTLGVLIEDGDAHGQMEPVQDVLGVGVEIELQLADVVGSVGDEGY